MKFRMGCSILGFLAFLVMLFPKGADMLTPVEAHDVRVPLRPLSPNPSQPLIATVIPPVNAPTTPSPTSTPVWSVVSGQNPGVSLNYLGGVSAVSASDVWSVGSYR